MATIKDLKEWLNRFPDETIVEFGVQGKSGNYESYGPLNFITPTLDSIDSGDGWEFMDFRTNPFVKEKDEAFGKCYLRIGEPN